MDLNIEIENVYKEKNNKKENSLQKLDSKIEKVYKSLNLKEPKKWHKFFKKKFVYIGIIFILILTLILSLSLTLTNNKNNKSDDFYAYNENCPYVINVESEQYVGYGRIGMVVAFELYPEYVPTDDYVYVYETSDNLQEEILVREIPIRYDRSIKFPDDEYPYGVYSIYDFIPYNFSNHEKNYSIQVNLSDLNGNEVGTVELNTFTLYDNRTPNGFNISPFTNVLNYLNIDWSYGNCYLHYQLFYPEGSGKIDEVLLVDENENIVSTSKPITGKNFEYDYRGILYLPPNYTSNPITYHIDIVYSHHIFPYSDLTKTFRMEIYDGITVYPF